MVIEKKIFLWGSCIIILIAMIMLFFTNISENNKPTDRESVEYQVSSLQEENYVLKTILHKELQEVTE